MIHPSGQSLALAIDDASAIGEARRVAMAMAGRLGFDETERGKVAIVATEAASNLSKHAQGGEILIQSWESGDLCGVDLLAVDKAPGMVDVDRCLVDGYSTAGSPGTGLGAMSRLASLLEQRIALLPTWNLGSSTCRWLARRSAAIRGRLPKRTAVGFCSWSTAWDTAPRQRKRPERLFAFLEKRRRRDRPR